MQRCDFCIYSDACKAGYNATDFARESGRFSELEYDDMCDGCYEEGRNPPYMLYSSATAQNINIMQPKDWLTLVFCLYIIAMTFANEMRDIKICQVTRAKRCNTGSEGGWKHNRAALAILSLGSFLRQFTIIPFLANTVITLVSVQGGDAVNVCLNAVAILFIMEVDNFTYQFVLSESLTNFVEEYGATELDQTERNQIDIIKTVYLFVSFTIMLLGIWLKRYDIPFGDVAITMFILLLGNWTGLVAEWYVEWDRRLNDLEKDGQEELRSAEEDEEERSDIKKRWDEFCANERVQACAWALKKLMLGLLGTLIGVWVLGAFFAEEQLDNDYDTDLRCANGDIVLAMTTD
jgi:hypothetical protein